jgi:hypothetical protein
MCEPAQHEHECSCQGGCRCGEHAHHCDAPCDCGSPCFQRRFQTKAERIAQLEAYLKDLKLEVQAVEETLVDLRRT